MFRLINYFQDIFKSNIKFYLLIFALISIIFVTQFNYWFGDFNRADLNSMKEEITQISKENEESFPEEEIPRNKMIKYLEKQISQLQQKKVEKCCFKKQNITRLKIKRITNLMKEDLLVISILIVTTYTIRKS